MTQRICDQCDCVAGCQSRARLCPNLAEPDHPAISELTIADLAMKHLGSYAEKDYDFAVAVISASKVAQPKDKPEHDPQSIPMSKTYYRKEGAP